MSWGDTERHRRLQSGGSPLLPSHEETLNNFGGGNVNGSYLPSSDPNTMTTDEINHTIDDYFIGYGTVSSQKEINGEYDEDYFNTNCNAIQQGFMQESESRNESNFLTSAGSYAGQVPSVGYNLSSNVDPSSQSPFGVLPHQAVKLAASRSLENYVSPDIKPIYNGSLLPDSKPIYNGSLLPDTKPIYNGSLLSDTKPIYNGSVLPDTKPIYNGSVLPDTKAIYNGSYTDWESNVPPNPLSVSSSISADTATPSPQTATLTPLSSNLSPGSNDTNFSPPMGAYNKSVHSPMTPSPSLAHHSYPSSPYANLDPLCHMSGAPPCSPINGGPYVNSMNSVPGRTGLQKQQLTPTSNGVMPHNTCYTPQSLVHGPMPKAQQDYHNDFNSFPQDRISPTFSSGYSSICSSRVSNDSMASPSPRGNTNFHETHVRYNHLRTVPPTTVSSPKYQQPSSMGHEMPYLPPTNMQPPPSYRQCPSAMTSYNNPVPSPAVPSNVPEHDQYEFPSDVVDDKATLEMFSSRRLDQGSNSMNHYLNYTDSNYSMMNTTPPRSSRSSRMGESRTNRQPIYNRGLVQPPTLYRESVKSEVPSAIPTYYDPTVEPVPVGNSTFDEPKKRGGRRGRKRGGTTGCRGRGRGRAQSYEKDKSVYFPSITRAHTIQQFKQEEDPTYYSGIPPLPIVQPSEPNSQNVNSIVRIQLRRFTEPYGIGLIKTEFTSLTSFFNQRRNTRSCSRRESPYVVQYKDFLNHQHTPVPGEVWPSKAPPKKTESIKMSGYCRKITIKLVPSKKSRKKWKCFSGSRDSPLTLTTDEEDNSDGSAEESDHDLLPSHKIKQEIKSDEERSDSVEASNTSQLTELQGRKSKSKIEKVQSVDSSSILPVREVEGRKENSPPMIDELDLTQTEKLGRNTPTLPSEEAVDIDDSVDGTVVKKEDRLLPARDLSNTIKAPCSGPSTREDSPDAYASDKYDHLDDSDTDPMWTPTAKSAKVTDTSKAFAGPSRKRGGKGGRKGGNRGGRRKAAAPPQENVPEKKKRQAAKPKAAPAPKKPPAAEAAGRGRIGTDRFLVAKADINQPTPFIWKVDRKSSMLQRFEATEQNGVHLYRSSFTYAAGNQFCVSNYVTADVKALSPDTVQYLGPNMSETAEMALAEMKSAEKEREKAKKKEKVRDQFIVYVQSLLSQDVDSTFLQEIKKFNDEYFLIPIANTEAIAEDKKTNILKEYWSEEFKNCIESYPHVNILDSAIEGINCQACKRTQGDKLLQFYGQAYDRMTLEPVNTPNPTANQFSVCDNCSTAVSFYSRLHHQKYNLFVECHSKANEVKSNNDNVQSHEDVLKICLEDNVWVEKVYNEHVKLWKECEKCS